MVKLYELKKSVINNEYFGKITEFSYRPGFIEFNVGRNTELREVQSRISLKQRLWGDYPEQSTPMSFYWH
ncbi:hypothetical protein V1477_008731 [Vespula maculifrons]|uniref:Uncharacterized protein n=2 Tax=Vespula TaxID=7451 RepID=A0A834JN87_VESVU|nr:hypothetical protein HZH66_009585 [Vespula vulgaris]